MKDFSFRRWNTILGWVVFAIAFYTYSSTVEPTASFWDPGEYIATAAKLEVGHPPGAPLFQMIGAVTSLFAPDKAHIALMVNMMSVLASALTILFLFWSISILVRKITRPDEKLLPGQKMAVLGSALVGSLAFAFTDSFWFSAVEAEVYGAAMCFMSALFYAGLLWERDMFKPRGHRRLILLALLVGLSFGIHFLALLAIPAIGYLYFFKTTEKVTTKNFIGASIVIIGILLFIFKLLLPYTLSFFAASEIFFVNSIELPFDSGTIIAGLVIIAIFYFLLRYTRKKSHTAANTIILSVLFIYIGFSCWIMLPIRANAGTTINENSPQNAQALLAYYNRDQYPSTPLFYGPQFTNAFAGLNKENPYVDGKPKYEENHEKGKYVIVNDWTNVIQNAPDDQKAIFPRMWSSGEPNIINYMNFTGPVKFHLRLEDRGNQQLRRLVNQVKAQYANGLIDNEGLTRFFTNYSRHLVIEKPTASANYQFLFQYQFWYMYFRYFLWNFVGRQDDTQGKYTNLHGNWMSGITPIDSYFFGSQENLPDHVKNEPARNTYYFLPLILGLIGLFFHYDRDKRNFWVVMVLFLFTGFILAFYLNMRAFEPRERDYAFVGSFYAFAVWIGFGVYSIFEKLKKYLKPKILAPVITVVCLLAVPTVLAKQNWNDHDRSGKRTATALAKNYLDSCAPNAILFTIGDNDTFPLWYVQEVEGYRTDVRIINTSLFATEWYIDQMKHKVYDNPGVKTILQHKDYTYGKNDVIPFRDDPRMPDTMKVKTWIRYIQSDNPSTKFTLPNDQTISLYPTKNLILPVNKKNVLANGIVEEKNKDKIVPYIPIHIGASQITKNTLLMLDVIASNNWERPIYFSGGSFKGSDYVWMKDYLQLTGLCYELVPIKTKVNPKNPYLMGRINTKKMYQTVMDWHWGNSGDPDMYYDPQTRRNSISYRSNMARLAKQLIAKNKTKKALDIVNLAMAKMPIDKIGYYSLVNPFITDYYKLGKPKRAKEIWDKLAVVYQQNLDYFYGLSLKAQQNYTQEIINNVERYRDLVTIAAKNEPTESVQKIVKKFNAYVDKFNNIYQGTGHFKLKSEPTKGFDPLKIDSLLNLPPIKDSI